MATLIASYYINTDDRNVFLVLDSAVCQMLTQYSGEHTDTGMWYLDTEVSSSKVCQSIINNFEIRKKELADSAKNKLLVDGSEISIIIHEVIEGNSAVHNDNRAADWLKSQSKNDQFSENSKIEETQT